MSGETEESHIVKRYFIKLREFITENQDMIYQALSNNTDLRKYVGYESIYFFAIDENNDLLKVGRTNDII